MTSDTQTESIHEKIVFTLANICAEPNYILKNHVVKRSGIIDYFDIMTNNMPESAAEYLPWALMNIFMGGMSYVFAREAIIPSCVKLSATCLNYLLNFENM